MSWLSDITGGAAQDASTAQQGDLMAGLTGASNYLNLNPAIIQSYGAQALQPYQQNYNTASPGYAASSNQLGNLLGQNGASGSQSALTSLETTPGYQFTKGQGDSAINASAAANGTLNSGNQLTALSNYDSGLAQNTYQNAVGNAQSALGTYGSQANAAAGGMAGVLGGEATALTGNNNAFAQLVQSTLASMGNSKASADLAQGSAEGGALSGALSLGSSLLGGVGGLSGLTSGLSGLFGGGSSAISSGIDGAYGGGGLDGLFT